MEMINFSFQPFCNSTHLVCVYSKCISKLQWVAQNVAWGSNFQIYLNVTVWFCKMQIAALSFQIYLPELQLVVGKIYFVCIYICPKNRFSLISQNIYFPVVVGCGSQMIISHGPLGRASSVGTGKHALHGVAQLVGIQGRPAILFSLMLMLTLPVPSYQRK